MGLEGAMSGLAAVVLVAAQVAGGEATSGLESLIPVGRVQVKVLRLSAPAPYSALLARFTAAAREHQAWLLEWVRKAGSGPLPWHPNLGLSKSEYEQFLALQSQLRFGVERTAQVNITRKGSRLLIEGGDEVPDLWEVEVDPKAMTVASPLGGCRDFREVEPSPNQRATGPWRGFACSATTGDHEKGTGSSFSFTIGRLVGDGEIFLSYVAKRLRDSRLERADVYLRLGAP
jgi:hypothetical protein